LVVVLTVIALAGLGAWKALAYIDENLSCPSAEWSENLASEVQSLLPSSAVWADPTISDCDDRRAVSVESVQITGTGSDLAAVQAAVEADANRSGWSQTGDPHCHEREFEGLSTSLQVVVDGAAVRVQALRGRC
jgi:hypothetical protein